MRLVKKWLFPVLTCLIVAGAALLPQRVSQARDDRQFGQAHTEELTVEFASVQEPPTLIDRLDLYVRWQNREGTIPDFRSAEENSMAEAEDLIHAGVEMLIVENVFPEEVMAGKKGRPVEITSWSYVLIWNPEQGVAQQEPCAIWELSAMLGDGSVGMTLDAETGLPLQINLYDTDLPLWLIRKGPDALTAVAERFLALLGLEGERMALAEVDGNIGQCLYHIVDTDLYYVIDITGKQLVISPEPKKLIDDYYFSEAFSTGIDG